MDIVCVVQKVPKSFKALRERKTENQKHVNRWIQRVNLSMHAVLVWILLLMHHSMVFSWANIADVNYISLPHGQCQGPI